MSEKQEKRALATNHVIYLLFNLAKMSIQRFKSAFTSENVAYEFRVARHSVICRKYSAVAILLLDLNILVVLIK